MLSKYLRVLPGRVWWVWLALTIGLGLTAYLFQTLAIKASIIQQSLRQEQTVAKAESSNITSFFQTFGEGIAVFAQLHSVDRRDAVTKQDMDAFVEQWRGSGIVGGIALTDSQGIVQFNSNVLGTSDVGASLADRDYFAWAKSQSAEGGYFISQPVISRLGATKGQMVVLVASPVVNQGVFAGVVAASVAFKPLTQKYLEFMKVSDSTDIFLIDQDGGLLYSSSAIYPAGSNAFDLLRKNPFLGSQILSDSLKDKLSTLQEGSLQTSYLDPRTNKLEPHLVAYSPIVLGSQKWLLIMGSPADNAMSFIVPFYIRQIAIFLVISLAILVFGVLTARENTLKRDSSSNRT